MATATAAYLALGVYLVGLFVILVFNYAAHVNDDAFDSDAVGGDAGDLSAAGDSSDQWFV